MGTVTNEASRPQSARTKHALNFKDRNFIRTEAAAGTSIEGAARKLNATTEVVAKFWPDKANDYIKKQAALLKPTMDGMPEAKRGTFRANKIREFARLLGMKSVDVAEVWDAQTTAPTQATSAGEEAVASEASAPNRRRRKTAGGGGE